MQAWFKDLSELEKKRKISKADSRKGIIDSVLIEADWRLRGFPIYLAIDRHSKMKHAVGNVTSPPKPLQGVYAHEGTAYQKAKKAGQYAHPLVSRFTTSATLLHKVNSPEANKWYDTRPANGPRSFEQLSEADFMALDMLLGHKLHVLYLSKFQRMRCMVAFERTSFVTVIDRAFVNMEGTTVAEDLGQGHVDSTAHEHIYAVDMYGNLYIMYGNLKDSEGKRVQLNHSTLCAGKPVLCAGDDLDQARGAHGDQQR